MALDKVGAAFPENILFIALKRPCCPSSVGSGEPMNIKGPVKSPTEPEAITNSPLCDVIDGMFCILPLLCLIICAMFVLLFFINTFSYTIDRDKSIYLFY